MEGGIPNPGDIWNGFVNNPIVQQAAFLFVVYIVLLWLGTAYWAFRDMQARTENPLLPYLAAALIIFFTPMLFLLAVVLYLIVRPRESMAEVYERSLAEESLLAEVEKQESCPTCRDRVEPAWLVCPNCRTRLHRVCPSCNRLADTGWALCAYCGREFERAERAERPGTVDVPGRADVPRPERAPAPRAVGS